MAGQPVTRYCNLELAARKEDPRLFRALGGYLLINNYSPIHVVDVSSTIVQKEIALSVTPRKLSDPLPNVSWYHSLRLLLRLLE